MKFNSTKNKIYKIWKNSEENQIKIAFQKPIYEELRALKDTVNTPNYHSTGFYYVSSEYGTLTVPGNNYEGYIRWDYELPDFPESWICQLEPRLIIKYNLEPVLTYFHHFHWTINVEDGNTRDVKNVLLSASITADTRYMPQDLKAKCLLLVPAPFMIV